MTITLRPFTEEDLPLYYAWAEKDPVKNTWFLEGYESVDAILEKLKGNGFDYPCIILMESRPIGYLLYCDLEASQRRCGVFPENIQGTYCFDLFIAEESDHNRGLGTETVRALCSQLFADPKVQRILVDPNAKNARAIRCFEKAGFTPLYRKHDGVCECLIMEKKAAPSK